MERAYKHAILIGAGLFVAVRFVLPPLISDTSSAAAEPQGYMSPDNPWSKPRGRPNDTRLPEDIPPEDATVPAGSAAPRQAAFRSSSADAWYPNCAAARAAGAAPIYAGEPGYRSELDGDSDGIACEPYRGR